MSGVEQTSACYLVSFDSSEVSPPAFLSMQLCVKTESGIVTLCSSECHAAPCKHFTCVKVFMQVC